MTDKDFDRLLKDALTSDDVPPSLNESLISLSLKRKNKKAKIFKFVKTFSSCAAVFVCAVAVLSYFNSDLFSKDSTSQLEEINTPITDENKSAKKDIIPENTSDVLSEVKNEAQKESDEATVTPKKAQPAKGTATETEDVAPLAETPTQIQEEAAILDADAAYEDETAPTDAPPSVFAMRKVVPAQSLHTLFNDDFDYKTIISEKISSQVAMLPYAQEVTFSQITGEEQFSLNEENMLTIEFAAGTIAPAQHGDLFFTVGTVQDGMLVE